MTRGITIHVGGDDAFTMTVSDANGNPVADLTNYHFLFQAREKIGADAALLSLSDAGGQIAKGAGSVTISIGHDDSGGINKTSGYCQVRVTDPLGKIRFVPEAPLPVTFEQPVVQ